MTQISPGLSPIHWDTYPATLKQRSDNHHIHIMKLQFVHLGTDKPWQGESKTIYYENARIEGANVIMEVATLAVNQALEALPIGTEVEGEAVVKASYQRKRPEIVLVGLASPSTSKAK